MQVTCEKCTAKYNIADDKIKASGTAVRCPKCQHVFKVFAGGPAGETVACANCGKQTAAVPGQAVVFCDDCRDQLAGGDAGGGAAPAPAADPFGGGDDPFSGDNLFKDPPPKPAAPPPAPSGGGVFDDAPAAPSGGGLFDDAPASPASGGGLFDEPASAGGGGGLFDEPASGGAAADPFAEFDSPAGAAPGAGAAHDPFAEFGDQPDDMGFAEQPESAGPPPPLMPDAPRQEAGDDEPAPAPVREKVQPKFKQTEQTGKEKAAEFFAEYGAKVAIFGGAGVAVIGLALTAALAFLPASFGARPTRPNDEPGLFARASFGLQKMLKTSYYGQAMEDAFIQAGNKAMQSWSGTGFAEAEKEYKALLAFDPANASAKGALLNLYATWDVVEETTRHAKDIAANLGAPKATDEARALALIALGQAKDVTAMTAKLADKADLYVSFAQLRQGDVTAPVEKIGAYAKARPKEFLPQLLYATALRDAKRYAEAVSVYGVAAQVAPGNAKANLELGKLYYGPLNDGDKAMAALNAALEAKAGGTDLLKAEARYYLSHILQKRGRGPAAFDAIQAALGVDAANPRYLTMSGDLSFDAGKVVDALTSYEKAAKADERFVDAYIGLGRANEKLDKQDVALQHYRKAIELDPVNMRANFLYAALILKQGKKDEAERVFTTVLERDPNNIEAIGQLARFYEDQERLGDALKEYARIIELAPDKIDGYVGRGAVLLRMGDISGAKSMFGKAAALEPEKPDVLFRLGQAAYLEGDFATAEASLVKALSRDPYHWEAHLYLGMAFAGQIKYDQALVEYQKTIDVNLRAAEAYRQRALVYLAQGRAGGLDKKKAAELLKKATEEIEKALYYAPNSPDYYYDYGVILDAQSLSGKARDQWNKAKELRPGFKEAMFALAAYYVSFTDYANAEAVLQEVLKSSPRNAQAYLGMGKVHAAKGNLDDAYRAFSRAAQLDPKDAEAQNLIGETYDKQGLAGQAFTYYQRAVRLNPKHGIAHLNLGLYWKDRDKNKAKKEFKAALESGTLTPEKYEEAQELLKEIEYVK